MSKIRSRVTPENRNLQKKLNSERRYLQRLVKRSGIKYDSSILDLDQFNFSCYLKSLQWVECQTCHKKSIHSSFKKFTCTKNCQLFTSENDLDPLGVPLELSSLTFIEKQLISRVHPVISLYRVKKLQYKYRGHVINFTQDVQHVADTLPHLVTDLNNVILVKLQDVTNLRDFVVRKDYVLRALIWLKEHNPHYTHVNIDMTKICLLPDESNVYDSMKISTVEDLPVEVKDAIDDLDEVEVSNDDDDTDDILYTSVPNYHHSSLSKSFNNELVWPNIGSTPLNEFSSPGYLSMAFPHLFPHGACDFSMPRSNRVTLKDYIHHLMLYRDQRFSKDERFRYFMMNTEMRWNALNVGNVYVQKNSIFSKMTILQLKDYFKENPWIVNQIIHFGSRMRSTKSYWNSRCSELLDMVNQIGTPTIFFTLSSADYHWPDLYRLLGFDVSKLSYKERANILAENPLVADTFFYMRSKFFLETCLRNHFNVQDMWYRYEYQHRGSVHLHGLLWLPDSPQITNDMSEDKKKEVLAYFDNLITCENPNIHLQPSSQHPCQISLDSVSDMDSDFCQLLNHVQRHTKCSKTHCLRISGKTKKLECRYKFPKQLMSESNFELKDDEVVDINFARNDVYLNKCNKWVLQTWRGNIDFSPILHKQIVYRYIAKYASKTEIKSETYTQILANVLNNQCDESDMAKKAIRKLLVSTCAERDYCSQEVMHFLMGFHFYHSSREFVVINLKSLHWSFVTFNNQRKNIFDHYSVRPIFLKNFSLFQFAKFVHVSRVGFLKRTRPAVVRSFPLITKKMSKDELSQHLAYLFYPWRSIEDLSCVDSVVMDYSMSMYQKYLVHDDNAEFYDSDDDEEEPVAGVPQNHDNQSILSSFNPNNISSRRDEFEGNDANNWDYLNKKVTRDTVSILYERLQVDVPPDDEEELNYSLLNRDQKKVFESIILLTNNILHNRVLNNPFIIVQGMAGTGKTFLLKCCSQYVRSHLGEHAVKLLAPTGVSAKLINGTTIHSFLSLGRSCFNFQRLTGLDLLNFRQKYNRLKFLFVDEYSMIGLKMLSCLDQRCKDLTDTETSFGNIIVVLFGDANQLMPIGDLPLYAEVTSLSQYNSLIEQGKLLMLRLTHAYVLKRCHRFANPQYVSFLRKVASGRCTVNDVNVLKSRYFNPMSPKEKYKFKNCISVAAKNETADVYNKRALRKLKKPIAVIRAQNNNKTAFSSSDDLADGLPNVVLLCIGAKVMLRRNLNISRGLVNGSIGIVKHILYEKDQKPPTLPVCVFIQFDNVNVSDLNINYIPIIPVMAQWYKRGISCTRFQLPITLCWCITIHKSQGLSLLCMALDAGTSEFAFGLLYVALSRVPDFQSLCLLAAITLDRLNSCKSSSRFKMKRRFLMKLKTFSNRFPL